MKTPFNKETNETLIFLIKDVFKIAFRNGFFDRYDYDAHVERLLDDYPDYKEAVHQYIIMNSYFHFVEYYLSHSIEETIHASLDLLKQENFDEIYIQWFNDLNASIIYEDEAFKIKTLKKISKAPIKKNSTQEAYIEKDYATESIVSSSDYLKINSAEAVNTWGLIPFYMFPFLVLSTLWVNENQFNNLFNYLFLIIYVLSSIGFYIAVYHSTHYLVKRPWLNFYGGLLIFFNLIAIGIPLNILSLVESPWVSQLIRLEIGPLIFPALIVFIGFYLTMNSIYYAWFNDPMQEGILYILLNFLVFVIYLIIRFLFRDFLLSEPLYLHLTSGLFMIFIINAFIQTIGSLIIRENEYYYWIVPYIIIFSGYYMFSN